MLIIIYEFLIFTLWNSKQHNTFSTLPLLGNFINENYYSPICNGEWQNRFYPNYVVQIYVITCYNGIGSSSSVASAQFATYFFAELFEKLSPPDTHASSVLYPGLIKFYSLFLLPRFYCYWPISLYIFLRDKAIAFSRCH